MLLKIKTSYGLAILGTCFLVAIFLITFSLNHFSAYTSISNSINPHTQLAQVADVTSGLVGHWTFDEGSGTTANDISGNGNNGTLVNNPLWISGKISQALKFDALGTVVVIPSSSTINNMQALTISAWVKANSFGENGIGTIVIKNSITTGWRLLSIGPNKMQFNVDYSVTDLGAMDTPKSRLQL